MVDMGLVMNSKYEPNIINLSYEVFTTDCEGVPERHKMEKDCICTFNSVNCQIEFLINSLISQGYTKQTIMNSVNEWIGEQEEDIEQ